MNWRLDTSVVGELPWKGYAVRRETSKVTGLPRIRYDRSAPSETRVPWRDKYRPSLMVPKPKAWIVPQQWREVVQRLQLNGVFMQPVPQDTLLTVEQDSIGDFSTVAMAYEGHWLHQDIHAARGRAQVLVHKGDWRVPTGRATDRYVMEALEPQADDSFFAWNFFDGILQRKEWYDDYVFEDLALAMLEQQPALHEAFQAKRAADPGFARDADAQLMWLYLRSPWAEPSFRKYPVLRVME